MSFFILSCSEEEKTFILLSPEETGITFKNELKEEARFNIFNYLYFYNGGGVAAGDVNNDGLVDLYFTSNQHSNELYINKGDLKFEDATEVAGVGGPNGWSTGVTMADVNADGLLDIYVSQLGDFLHITGRNQLFINMGNDENGIPIFDEQAAEFQLDLIGFSTQAAFFDYDLDDDLDMYMLNHSVHSNGTFARADIRDQPHALAGDKLLRNDNGKFIDVSKEAGIYSSVLGYGLGVGVGDLNGDGFPDIYVGNDFHENDYLYINNGDGTFTEQLSDYIEHTSRFSMGNDLADFNNDGLIDILSLDMLPENPEILKSSAGEDNYDVYKFKLNFGYEHQFSRNTLQLNQGNGKFSEIGLLSGMAATDWSWAGLMADFDLDGNKDIFIANGIKRRSNDLDYINYISNDAIQHRLGGDLSDDELALIEQMPVVKIENYIFKNNGDLTFTNASHEWGIAQPSFSNGAAYADLDNDGDLDLITNNIDQEAFIYENRTLQKKNNANRYLKVQLKGPAQNLFAIGSTIIIPSERGTIIQELYPARGYQSSVPAEFVVGLGKQEVLDSVIIVWPDRSYQVLKNVSTNQTLQVNYSEASNNLWHGQQEIKPARYVHIEDKVRLNFWHQENDFNEFNREALIPHMASAEGPCIAVGDINNDGRDDLFFGGAKWQPSVIFLNNPEGFTEVNMPDIRTDSIHEDTDAVFVDVDNDNYNDLIIVSGGNEYRLSGEPLQVRLYRNDGMGSLKKDAEAFKDIHITASVIEPHDFDNDGDQDLFIGGRVLPWNYGLSPRSYLMENDGKGSFTDVTPKSLMEIGMVKDATWEDLNGDGIKELLVIGEWMTLTIFKNTNGNITLVTNNALKQFAGWWNTIEVEDIDGDGDLDVMAGNLGLNSKLKASAEEPVTLYVKDFDNNGKVDQLLYHYMNGKEYLFATKDELSKQLVEFKSRYTSYSGFAEAEEVFDRSKLNEARKAEAYEFRSGIFINEGDFNFSFRPFPVEGQLSPVFDIITITNDDQSMDIILAGNQYEVNVQRGRYDASFGTLLNNERGKLSVIDEVRSGIKLSGQTRDIKKIEFNNEELILFSTNNGPVQLIKKNR